MTTSALAPEMGAAWQTLLSFGVAHEQTLTASSEKQLTERVEQRIVNPALAQGFNPSALLLLLADEQVRAALLTRYVESFEAAALQHNQFLLIGPERRTELDEIYDAFLDDVPDVLGAGGGPSGTAPSVDGSVEDAEAAPLREAIVDHHVALWQFAQALIKEQFVVDVTDLGAGAPGTAPSAETSVAFTPPCHEYDPEFQLALWGITPANLRSELKEPILDLGCGQQASLVRYLRAAGLEAYGVDRFVDADPAGGGDGRGGDGRGGEGRSPVDGDSDGLVDGEFLRQGDWLDTPLQPKSWGTIISHMGFSNHFFHHHLRKDGHPERYARRFMDILGALKQGGRFLYAPGLPFFEPLLPEAEAQVVIHPIDVDADAIGLGRKGTGGGYNGIASSDGAPEGAVERRPALYATEIRVLGNE